MAKLIIVITEQLAFVKEISHTLRQAEYFVLKGNHPEHVIEMIKSMIPDMIIIDEVFGKDTLITFSQQVHLNSHTKTTSVVALVSTSSDKVKHEFSSHGIKAVISRDDLLKKPLQLISNLMLNGNGSSS
ncbi:MAG: response regulator [Anaerolineae bacterium]|nr:MAG: response regulator [Anaerolineae bacterium]